MAAVLFPAGLLASWLIARAYSNARQAVERNLSESARALSLLTDATLREQEARLDGLATSLQPDRNDLDAFRVQAGSLMPTPDQWFVLTDAEGRQLVNTSQPEGVPLPQMAVLPEMRETLRAGQVYISNFSVGPATGLPVVFVTKVVLREGAPPRTLSAVLSTTTISNALLNQAIGAGWLIALIDREGTIIARSRDPEKYVGKRASDSMYAATTAATAGSIESVTLDGVRSFTAFNRSPRSGWTVILAAPQSELLAGSQTLAVVAGVVSLLCGVTGVLLAVSVGRAVVRGVHTLVSQTQALGRGPVPMQETGMDETDFVSHALSEASRALATREAELAGARDEALAASRAKDEFLATLSHELRTPLNPVLLLASDAASDASLAPEVRETFESIVKNVQLEARLIDDLLDLTRITRGKLSLEKQPLDVHAVVRDALATVRGVALEKKIGMRADFHAGTTVVDGDPTRLQQVFWNLLNNAIKFTPPGGRVQVTTESTIAAIEITISDTGLGMTAIELERIFQAFVQGEHAAAGSGSRFGGLGLGLTISRLLVEKHGGRITAASAGRNQGATFTVQLPLVPTK